MVHMIQEAERKICDIVRDDYRTAEVFQRYGINYCCGGNQSLAAACEARSIDKDLLLMDLEKATRIVSLSNQLPYESWKTGFLIDYIVNVHHAYIRMTVPLLQSQLGSFASGHRKQHPYLDQLVETFTELCGLLEAQNRQEEEIIFPYIQLVENTFRRKETYGSLFVRTLRKPLGSMESEHVKAGSLIDRIRELTNGYRYPDNACTNHQVVFRKLQEFDRDLVQHKHLELNILFPKAQEMEKALLQTE